MSKEPFSDLSSEAQHKRSTCNDNGRILLSVPAFNSLMSDWDRMLGHHRRYSKKMIYDLMSKVDGEVEYISYGFGPLYPVTFLMRKLFKDRKKVVYTLPKMNKILNNFIIYTLKLEIFLSRFISIPFGTSLFVVLKKSSHQK